MYANRFIPKYCNEKLVWYDRNYDFIDLNKWEEFDKDKDIYISNVNITSFSKVYRDIGFKPEPGSLKRTVNFSQSELEKFDAVIKNTETINEPLIEQITDKNKKTEALSSCFRTERKYIFVEKGLILQPFKYLKEW